MVAGKANGYGDAPASRVVATMAKAYREYIVHLADMQALEVWYPRLDADVLLETASSKWARRDCKSMIEKARTQVAEHAVPRLTTIVNGRRRFLETPPLGYHEGWGREQYDRFLGLFEQYRASLRDDQRVILDRYRMVDVAFKVAGIGSAETRGGWPCSWPTAGTR